MVSVLAFNSDDPSSNPAGVYNFSCINCCWKERNKQKEAGNGPFLKIYLRMPNEVVHEALDQIAFN